MNLPNKISVARILLIPLVIFFYLADFIPWGKFIAGIIFIIACCTDFIDGHIARSRNLVTNLGKFLDPIADKVLVMSSLFLLVAWPVLGKTIMWPNYVSIVCAIIIMARELIISSFRQIAATKNVVLAADVYGKVKTIFQDITLVLYFVYAFLVAEFNSAIAGVPNTVISIVCLVMLVISTILTIISGVNYVVKNKKVLQDEN